MIRLAAVAVWASLILTAALAWSLREEVAYAAEPAPVRAEPAEDLWRAAAAGCVDAGGTWWQGSESGVVVGRCRPWVGNLGVVPVAGRSR